MKTIAITLAALLAATLAAHAQIDVNNIKSITVNKTGTNAEVTAMREIGRSTLECVYKALSPERGNEEQPIRMKEDRMILQTGGGVSKFYSYYRFAMDSLQKADPTNVMNTAQRKDGTTACLYMGYPEAGRLTLTEGIGSTYYLYEDEVPEIGWTIGDEKREILGYACRRADCTLYGRRFTAWFTEEIPVMSGPWKLHGLPGLIMAAADDEGLYSFEIIGLRNVERTIEYSDRKYIETTREKYLRQLHRFKNNPIGYMILSGEMIIETRDGSEPTTENGMEEFSMIETDYKP